MQTLRDDIYEKGSIVYTGRAKLEQDTISVADAEVVQKLLEELPCSLATKYKITVRYGKVINRYKKTRRAAREVTQLMQPGAWSVCVCRCVGSQ